MRFSLFRHIEKKPRTLFITISVVIHVLLIFGLVVVFFPKNLQQDSTTPISVMLIDSDQKQSAIATAAEPLVTTPVASRPLVADLIATKPVTTESSILKKILGEPVAPIIDSQKSIQISGTKTNQYSIASLTKKFSKELTATEALSTDLLIDRLEKTRQLVLDLTADAIEKIGPIYMQAFKSDSQISSLSLDSTLATYPIGHELTKVVLAYSNGTQLCAEFTESDPLDAFTTGVWRTWLLGCR